MRYADLERAFNMTRIVQKQTKNIKKITAMSLNYFFGTSFNPPHYSTFMELSIPNIVTVTDSLASFISRLKLNSPV